MRRSKLVGAAMLAVVLGLSASSPAGADVNPLGVAGDVFRGAISSLLTNTRARFAWLADASGLPLDDETTIMIVVNPLDMNSILRAEESWARLNQDDPAFALAVLRNEAALRRLCYDAAVHTCTSVGYRVVGDLDTVDRYTAWREAAKANPQVRQGSLPLGGDIETPSQFLEISFQPLISVNDELKLRALGVSKREGASVTTLRFLSADTLETLNSLVIDVETDQVSLQSDGRRGGVSQVLTYAHLNVTMNAAMKELTALREQYRRVYSGELGLLVDETSPQNMRLVELAGLPDPRVFRIYAGGLTYITAGRNNGLAEGSLVEIRGRRYPIARVMANSATIRMMDQGVPENEQVRINDPVTIVPAAPPVAPTTAPVVTTPAATAPAATAPTTTASGNQLPIANGEPWQRALAAAKPGDQIELPATVLLSPGPRGPDGSWRIDIPAWRLGEGTRRGQVVWLVPHEDGDRFGAPLPGVLVVPKRAMTSATTSGPGWQVAVLSNPQALGEVWEAWLEPVDRPATPAVSVPEEAAEPRFTGQYAAFLNAVAAAPIGEMLADVPKLANTDELRAAPAGTLSPPPVNVSETTWRRHLPGQVGRVVHLDADGQELGDRWFKAVVIGYSQAPARPDGSSRYQLFIWVLTSELSPLPAGHQWQLIWTAPPPLDE